MKPGVPSENSAYSVTRRGGFRADEIKADWQALERRSNCSFFQSWGWIGGWLEHVVKDRNPELIQVFHGDRLVAMGIFLEKVIERRCIIRSSGIFLNEYPADDLDMAIEYNGLLVDGEHHDPVSVYQVLLANLTAGSRSYDEICFGGVSKNPVFDSLQKAKIDSHKLVLGEVSDSWQVNLEGAGSGVDAVLGPLSKNRRTQIRRSMRLYQESGELQLHEADSVDQALEYFSGLERLHNERWQRKGVPGSFANPVWVRFHRALIRDRYDPGEVQLIKVELDGKPIGYLYNFIWRKRVYVLQTGFAINDDKRLMPGYISQVMAIAHNKARGMAIYDFMHGDSVYKRVLSNQSETLYWLAMQRRCAKFTLENSLLAVYRGLKRGFRQG